MNNSATCPHCGGNNVLIQAVSNTYSTKRKGCAYWLIIGWWLEPLLWIFLTLPKLLYELLRGGKTKTEIKTMAVCQSCGYRWQINRPITPNNKVQSTSAQQQSLNQRQSVNLGQSVNISGSSDSQGNQRVAGTEKKTNKPSPVMIIAIVAASLFVGSAAIAGIIQGITNPDKKKSATDSAVSSEVSEKSEESSSATIDKGGTVIDCDSMNVLSSGYYKSFMYGDGGEPVLKSGWQVPKGKYRIDVIKTKAWVQVSFYEAKSGTPEPVMSDKAPILLKKGETAVVEMNGEEYLDIAEPDHITLTMLSEENN